MALAFTTLLVQHKNLDCGAGESTGSERKREPRTEEVAPNKSAL